MPKSLTVHLDVYIKMLPADYGETKTFPHQMQQSNFHYHNCNTLCLMSSRWCSVMQTLDKNVCETEECIFSRADQKKWYHRKIITIFYRAVFFFMGQTWKCKLQLRLQTERFIWGKWIGLLTILLCDTAYRVIRSIFYIYCCFVHCFVCMVLDGWFLHCFFFFFFP